MLVQIRFLYTGNDVVFKQYICICNAIFVYVYVCVRERESANESKIYKLPITKPDINNFCNHCIVKNLRQTSLN